MKKILAILTVALVLTSCACDAPAGDVVTTDSTEVSVDTLSTSVTETFIGDCVEGTTTVTE